MSDMRLSCRDAVQKACLGSQRQAKAYRTSPFPLLLNPVLDSQQHDRQDSEPGADAQRAPTSARFRPSARF